MTNNYRAEYSQLLKDPKWQKKRLEVMERDQFTCQSCFDSDSTLNVHHKHYTWGLKPWDYEPDLLITLCESCHETETENIKQARKNLLRAISRNCYGFIELNRLASAFDKAADDKRILKEPDTSIIEFLLSNEDAWKVIEDMFWKKLKLEQDGQ